jgi:hypothetical protein
MAALMVPEIPRLERVELPADTTAMLVVDMQNDFARERPVR